MHSCLVVSVRSPARQGCSRGCLACAAGHLALPIMLGALCKEGEAQLLGEARALYENHERDAGDTILMAFRADNWTKVGACAK